MNEYLASAVDELYQLGVREVVLSPGSRSTPLSVLFCAYQKYQIYMNIDERSAAFFALGIAKTQNRPVVLVCTSGSAVTHYFPAVVEAKHANLPLIMLSADRPPEMQHIAAPQTIDQNRIFTGFVNHYETLSIPPEKQAFSYPRLVMQKAYLKAHGLVSGPVQVNVPLREPLLPDLTKVNFELGRQPIATTMERSLVQGKLKVEYIEGKKGLIVCGGNLAIADHPFIIQLAERLNIPILADPLSNLRNYASNQIIDSYDAFLKDSRIVEELQPEYVLFFGHTVVSKRLQNFLAAHKNSQCFQIDAAGIYRNASLAAVTHIQSDIQSLVESTQIKSAITSDYLKKWQKYQQEMRAKLETVTEITELFEGKIIQVLQAMLPAHSNLLVANSMAIRDIDFFWKAKEQKITILCNRGTNGIDGTISTALGAASSGRPTVLLTGDLAFFHDMNGLLLGKTHFLKLVIILVNNDGGGIFQYLPQKGQPYFDYLFNTSHGIDFQGVQTLYGCQYYRPENYQEFQNYFQDALQATGITIIEISTNKERSYELHEKYTTR